MVAHVLDLILKEMNQNTFDTGVAIILTVRAPLRPAASIFFTQFFSAVYNQGS